jgi:hypothetical protein
MTVTEIGGIRVYALPAAGPPLGSERDAIDIIGETYGMDIGLIAIPAARLHPDFLRLRTRMAGEFLQKMQNYGLRAAIVGDIAAAVAGSTALRDFVYESNAVGQVLFATDDADLARRLITQR